MINCVVYIIYLPCAKYITMAKKYTFLDSPQWDEIVNNIKGIYTSDGSMATLLDFERVLDEADIYAFKNWKYGELVDGPVVHRYTVTCTFMWPMSLLPDPRGIKRLIPMKCKIRWKKTKINIPVKIKTPDDFFEGNHYPKLVEQPIWLFSITMPKKLLSDIREGSVDIADQNIDLADLDDAYEKDFDTAGIRPEDQAQGSLGGMTPMGGGGLLGPGPSALGGPPLGGPGMPL